MNAEYTNTVFPVNHHYTDLAIPLTMLVRENAEMEFTANLKRFREARGLKQEQLAELVGVAQATIQRWENGKREPKHADLENLALHLGVTVAQLFGGEAVSVRPDDAQDVVDFTLLGDVPAGPWREAIRTSSNKVQVPASEAPKQGYALRVQGDSMDLVVADGTTILVNPGDTDLWPGKLYVVMDEYGDVTFKRYLDNPARLVPCSSNPAHKEITLSGGGFKILGRVCWQGGPL